MDFSEPLPTHRRLDARRPRHKKYPSHIWLVPRDVWVLPTLCFDSRFFRSDRRPERVMRQPHGAESWKSQLCSSLLHNSRRLSRPHSPAENGDYVKSHPACPSHTGSTSSIDPTRHSPHVARQFRHSAGQPAVYTLVKYRARATSWYDTVTGGRPALSYMVTPSRDARPESSPKTETACHDFAHPVRPRHLVSPASGRTLFPGRGERVAHRRGQRRRAVRADPSSFGNGRWDPNSRYGVWRSGDHACAAPPTDVPAAADSIRVADGSGHHCGRGHRLLRVVHYGHPKSFDRFPPPGGCRCGGLARLGRCEHNRLQRLVASARDRRRAVPALVGTDTGDRGHLVTDGWAAWS